MKKLTGMALHSVFHQKSFKWFWCIPESKNHWSRKTPLYSAENKLILTRMWSYCLAGDCWCNQSADRWEASDTWLFPGPSSLYYKQRAYPMTGCCDGYSGNTPVVLICSVLLIFPNVSSNWWIDWQNGLRREESLPGCKQLVNRAKEAVVVIQTAFS